MPKKKVNKHTAGGTINPKVLKVNDLKKELKKRKLETSGLKAALIKRLEESIEMEKQPQDDDDDDDDDNEEEQPNNNMDIETESSTTKTKEEQPQPTISKIKTKQNKMNTTIKSEIIMTKTTTPTTPSSKLSHHIFQPLYGAQTDGPVCFVLETDSVTILLDCGWDETFDINILEPLRNIASKVDLILISHGDLNHIGALPYALKQFDFKKNPPVYLTIPVQRLGEMCLLDALFNRGWSGRDTLLVKKNDMDDDDINEEEDENKQLFTVEDIEYCFREKSIPLNYRQNLTITGLEKGSMTITPFSAGHTLGMLSFYSK